MLSARRVIAGSIAALVATASLMALGLQPAGATAPAGATGDSGEQATEKKGRPYATLEIIEPNVSLRRKDADEFKPAKDGQRLRVGDTVKTDGTGFAAIHYTDEEESFTRLDVDTEFTIVSLTDEQGNRKVLGSLDVGRTWNRTTALTETEEFGQEGAGATAAVEGTAFMVVCTGPGNCVFISVVDGVTLRTVDGELVSLDPLQQCDATEVDESNSDLCGAPEDVALEVLLADAWIAENLFLDGLAGHPGPVAGTVEVEGIAVTFTPAGSSGGTSQSSTPTTTPPTTTPPNDPPDDPVVDSVTVSLNPTSIPADEPLNVTAAVAATSEVTVEVKDANGNGIAGKSVEITSDDASNAIGGINEGSNPGTYTAEITASPTPGTKTITATVDGVQGTALLDQTPVNDPSAVASVRLTIAPDAIAADPCETTTGTIEVKAANGNLIPAQTPVMSTNVIDGAVTFGQVTYNNSDGKYHVTITASDTPGHQTIKAMVGDFYHQRKLTLNSGQPHCATSTSTGISAFSLASVSEPLTPTEPADTEEPTERETEDPVTSDPSEPAVEPEPVKIPEPEPEATPPNPPEDPPAEAVETAESAEPTAEA